MTRPALVLAVLAVMVAWAPSWCRSTPRRLPGPPPAATDDGRTVIAAAGFMLLATTVLAAAVPATLAVLADPLARQLAVSAPTVRVAAGVALLVGGLSRPGSRPARQRGSNHLLVDLVEGPLRVEVGMTVWVLALDRGTGTALATVAGLATVSAGLSVRRSRRAHKGLEASDLDPAHGSRCAARPALLAGTVVVAVLLSINGVLGL